MRKILWLILIASVICASEQYYERGSLQTLEPSNPPATMQRSANSVDWYQTSDGFTVGVDGSIIVKLSDSSIARNLSNTYPIEILEELSESMFVVTVKDGSDFFEVCRDLHEDSSVVFAHPNMIRERSVR